MFLTVPTVLFRSIGFAAYTKRFCLMIASILICLPLMAGQAIANADSSAKKKTDEKPLDITFTLPEIATGQYQRPYVAVWIENSKGKSVKTLAVWHGDKKWLKDLRRWWRKAGRYIESSSAPADKALSDSFTGATRSPGCYSLSWDGLDDAGQPLADGDYQLVLEAAREHGSRTLLKQKFKLPDTNTRFRIKAGKELGPVDIVQP